MTTVSVRLHAGFDEVLTSTSYEPAHRKVKTFWVSKTPPLILYTNPVWPLHDTVIRPSVHPQVRGVVIATDHVNSHNSKGHGSHAEGHAVYHPKGLLSPSKTVQATWYHARISPAGIVPVGFVDDRVIFSPVS
jgi:hypothetical protein